MMPPHITHPIRGPRVVKMRSYDTAGAADCLLGADPAVLVRLGLTPPYTDRWVL